jgi:hypothetical protein
MDAKVHLARPVHHRDAEEMIGLALPALRQTTAVELVGLVADLDVAVRRPRHNFRELSQAQGRDFRPWASADAEPAGLNLPFQEMQLLVASAGPEQVAPVVAIAEVEALPVWERRDAVHPETARHAVAKVRQAAAMAAERLAS